MTIEIGWRLFFALVLFAFAISEIADKRRLEE